MKYKTRKSIDRPGDAHGLTFSLYRRIRVFNDPTACQIFLDCLATAAQKNSFEIWAYVIMPDHVHVVCFPTNPTYAVESILKSIKIASAKRIFEEFPTLRSKFLVPGTGACRLWQAGGGYDRNYYTGHHTWTFIDYVHNNPVVEGLCARPEDWPWSSAGFYNSGEASSGLLTRCPWFRS